MDSYSIELPVNLVRELIQEETKRNVNYEGMNILDQINSALSQDLIDQEFAEFLQMNIGTGFSSGWINNNL